MKQMSNPVILNLIMILNQHKSKCKDNQRKSDSEMKMKLNDCNCSLIKKLNWVMNKNLQRISDLDDLEYFDGEYNQ